MVWTVLTERPVSSLIRVMIKRLSESKTVHFGYLSIGSSNRQTSNVKKQKIEPILYMTEWFLCVFTRTLPWATILRIWDMFLCEEFSSPQKAFKMPNARSVLIAVAKEVFINDSSRGDGSALYLTLTFCSCEDSLQSSTGTTETESKRKINASLKEKVPNNV
ncbi:hypothetical protein J6590_074415 [Homalodisca vitripennis]|nr:hypothetical protein J6590_074415 [Homalodisca vitripennis]